MSTGTCSIADELPWGRPRSHAGRGATDYDVHVPLLSLPAIFGTTLEDIPAEVPYLAADPTLVAAWKREFEGHDGFKIGVAWHGNPRHPLNPLRSFHPSYLGAIAAVEGVRLYSLQTACAMNSQGRRACPSWTWKTAWAIFTIRLPSCRIWIW